MSSKLNRALAAGVGLSVSGLAAHSASAANPQLQPEPTTSTLFSDDFSGGFGKWIVGTNTIDNTTFGQTPTLVTGAAGAVSTYAQFKLDTYDPATGQAGNTYLGTQLQTKQNFGPPHEQRCHHRAGNPVPHRLPRRSRRLGRPAGRDDQHRRHRRGGP